MSQRLLLPSVCFLFSSLVCLPSAQAGYLNINFQGAVTSAYNEGGNLFDVNDGDPVTGSFLIDLDFAERYSSGFEVGGDAYYSANEGLGPQRYITSQINIGDRNFVFGPSTTYPSDEEYVWMFKANVYDIDFEGPRDFLAIQDEYYYEYYDDNGVGIGISGFSLNISMIDMLDSFLSSLDLDQEFSWVNNSDLPGIGAGGSLRAEADVGIGAANFKLNAVQATLVPTEVPEPGSFGLLLTALLVGMGLRKFHMK